MQNNMNKQEGQAILMVVFIFLLLMLSVVLGVAITQLSTTRIVRGFEGSIQSYTAAESLLEDTIYRLNNSYDVASVEALTIDGVVVTAAITDISNGKNIIVEGDANNRIRRVETNVILGSGVAFHFGVQVGAGGFIMDNNSFVVGNVYSNGSIEGSSGTYVTGSAIAVGSSGVIGDVNVGTESTDEAWAHTINNVSVTGPLYCQTGSGNNKSCDTSRSDPESQAFPITDEDINAWKASAEAGTVISGNYMVPANDTITLGPAKITGNMSFGNSATLVLTGPVWVEGSITTGNNSIVSLHSSYGSSSEVLFTDSPISLSNNTNFSGSGSEGSYIILLTTSSSLSAIDVSNNAGTVILNAQNGKINFSNNAGAKQATADTIFLNNNASIIYETGLADVNFSSGPSGGFEVDSWEEVE